MGNKMEFYKKEKLKNLGLLPDMAAQKNGSRTAIFFEDKEQSFIDLCLRSSKLASGLRNIGVKTGEKIGLYIPNSLQFPETFFGVIKAGAIPLPLNLRMPTSTLSYVLENSDAKTLIGSSLESKVSDPEVAKELQKSTNCERLIMPDVEEDGIIDYSKLIKEGDASLGHINKEYEDTAVMMYTSGTTGKPKGVPLTHENVLSEVEAMAQAADEDASARALMVLPLYHMFCLNDILLKLIYEGGSLVVQTEPDPELILKNIDEYNCTCFLGVPALFRMIWQIYNQDTEKYDLSSLDYVGCGAAPLDEKTRVEIKREWKVRFEEGWGMTETVAGGFANHGTMNKGAGCVGWPIKNYEMKLVNPQTRETIVPWKSIATWGELEDENVDKSGELAIRGPAVFEGYYKLPEKNEEVFDEDGWFYTGDVMRIDEDKAFLMVERTDNMIVSGGENIYPSHVEEAMQDHPEITDVGVVAAPHKTKGEVPVAFVVTQDGSDLTEEEVKEFALEKVPTYAHPRRVFFVDDIPKSAALKIQHFKLEEKVEERISEPLG